nr:PAS domain-containing protein [uncultured Pseudomonas sp.]
MINAQLLQSMVDASNDGIVVCEQEGDDTILIYVNAAFERLTGFSRDEILYQDCRFLQGDDRDQLARLRIRKAMLEGMPCREVLLNYRKDGTTFWNELSITPVHNEADQRRYFIGIQKDVSRQVELQRNLEQCQAQLADLKSELLK